MPIVNVNDIDLYYETQGEGTPIVMINGYGSSSESWKSCPMVIQELAQRHQVILFDNRGTGRSDKPDDTYSIRDMADDTVGLMTALNIPKAHVLGASMGGMIAQELTLNDPDKVISLILCCTSCNPTLTIEETDPDFRNFIETSAAGQPPALSPEEFVGLYFKWMFTPPYIEQHRAELIQARMAMQYPTPPHTFTRQAQAVLQHDVCDKLHEIQASTLVLHGEEDVLLPPANATTLAENIPNVEVQIFRDAAHGFFIEVEKQTANAILNFLATIEKRQ